MKYCVVFGCCTLDIAHYELDGKTDTSFGGKGGNQAVALARAGIKTYMLTVLSKMKSDKKSTKLHLKNLKNNKINTKYIDYDSNYHNDFTEITIASNGDNFLNEKIDISGQFTTDYIEKNRKILENAEFVLLQMKVPIETTRKVIQICKNAGVKTVLTPCRPKKANENRDVLENVDIITCNEKEAREIFTHEEKLSLKNLDLVLKKYPNKLMVTLGKNGVRYFDGEKIIFEKGIKIEDVKNTTGAGDTFCGNLVACLADGDELNVAIRKAICSSTLKIKIPGTQNGMPTKKERDLLYKKIYLEEKND